MPVAVKANKKTVPLKLVCYDQFESTERKSAPSIHIPVGLETIKISAICSAVKITG